MPDPMYWLSVAAFAWGLSLATYRWIATHAGWPMGEWQAHRPGLPIAIGVFCMLVAVMFAVARGGPATLALPLLGTVLAIGWTAVTRVVAQSALLFAPVAVVVLMALWMTAASHVTAHHDADTITVAPAIGRYPAATDREGVVAERDRGITRIEPRVPVPYPR